MSKSGSDWNPLLCPSIYPDEMVEREARRSLGDKPGCFFLDIPLHSWIMAFFIGQYATLLENCE